MNTTKKVNEENVGFIKNNEDKIKEEEQTFINYFGFDSWVRINQQLYK